MPWLKTTVSRSLKITTKVRLADYPHNLQYGHFSVWATISSGDFGEWNPDRNLNLEPGPGRMMYGSNLARKSPVVDPSKTS
ncbi:hypothetical protein BDW68DRAFT_175947 [Aspergillus falconensis]